jgi:hypothetical protein
MSAVYSASDVAKNTEFPALRLPVCPNTFHPKSELTSARAAVCQSWQKSLLYPLG